MDRFDTLNTTYGVRMTTHVATDGTVTIGDSVLCCVFCCCWVLFASGGGGGEEGEEVAFCLVPCVNSLFETGVEDKCDLWR